ncbi:MAG: prephenate dehydrogenase [Deltaproteobacteria bacterium CG11_big_fil_rev_8_21_14_0_20_47_16]|nr:MAG: prephenate dehydrogenase [Deltaproteobacteria bacterium CG11_big_fil_rev_8_21_14_0_20_47_16]
MTIGIVGFGRFGQLLAESLKPIGDVVVYDPNPQRFSQESGFALTPLEQVVKSDILFLTVPISTFEAVCESIKNDLNPEAIVLDCCSVKVHPASVMKNTFSPAQAIIATHPLFGPDSAKRTNGIRGHRIVLCPIHASAEQKQKITDLFTQLGLITIDSTPEEHDRQMARSQGLVHFIGRGLEALHLQQQLLSTPDFQSLLSINAMVVNDAWQLFLDMHRFNPYAKEIRRGLLQQLTALDRSIGEGNDPKDA